MFRKYSSAFFALAFVLSASSYSKDYRDVKVGKFQRTFDLSDCNNKTFLNFMKTSVYDAIKEEAASSESRDHLTAVKNGEGVEIKLTDDVTTFHVKYKSADEENAERSGRSYAAVGRSRGGVVDYLADASDKFYLDSLEKIAQDENELENFYRAIFGVVATCDASGFDKLSVETQRVAADFVAVYVAEQYRHLIGGDGDLGPTFNWDDALLQVTMLASYHSGQARNNRGMFYEGEFTDEVYNQVNEDEDGTKYCVYKQFQADARDMFDRRKSRLNDYWQMNRECKRSGINMTRSDFTKMAKAITAYATEYLPEEYAAVAGSFADEESENVYGSISKFFIDNDAPESLKRKAKGMIENTVAFLMAVRGHAGEITDGLKH